MKVAKPGVELIPLVITAPSLGTTKFMFWYPKCDPMVVVPSANQSRPTASDGVTGALRLNKTVFMNPFVKVGGPLPEVVDCARAKKKVDPPICTGLAVASAAGIEKPTNSFSSSEPVVGANVGEVELTTIPQIIPFWDVVVKFPHPDVPILRLTLASSG